MYPEHTIKKAESSSFYRAGGESTNDFVMKEHIDDHAGKNTTDKRRIHTAVISDELAGKKLDS
jgi:hypothetical protein